MFKQLNNLNNKAMIFRHLEKTVKTFKYLRIHFWKYKKNWYVRLFPNSDIIIKVIEINEL